MSYLGAPICIISTAQQAKPNIRGNIEHFLPQFNKSSKRVKAYSAKLSFETLNGEYGLS